VDPRTHLPQSAAGTNRDAPAITVSQQQSDELYRQSKLFAPPPPPSALKTDPLLAERVARWYHFVSSWDLTHTQPPPPQSPVPLLQQRKQYQQQQQLNGAAVAPFAMNSIPYEADFWVKQCERWQEQTEKSFLHFAGAGPQSGVGGGVGRGGRGGVGLVAEKPRAPAPALANTAAARLPDAELLELAVVE